MSTTSLTTTKGTSPATAGSGEEAIVRQEAKEQTQPQPGRPPSRAPHVILSIAAAICMIIVALTWAAYMMLVKAPVTMVQTGVESVRVETGKVVGDSYDFARRVAKDVASWAQVQPEIRISHTTIVESSRAIAELATVERPMVVESEVTNTWLGSTKVLKLRGTFLVKAGFDLREDALKMLIDDKSGEIAMTMPEAKLLSMECTKVEFMEDISGWWNSMTKEERERSVNDLRTEALKRAKAGTILQEARRNMEDKLKEIILKNTHPMKFQYNAPPPELPGPEKPPELKQG
ncbi:MAG: DUF4230 domain-containing protein [Candidatus Methylacidiphilales bacterium]